MFQSASTDLGHALVVCDFFKFKITIILILEAMNNIFHIGQWTNHPATLSLLSLLLHRNQFSFHHNFCFSPFEMSTFAIPGPISKKYKVLIIFGVPNKTLAFSCSK